MQVPDKGAAGDQKQQLREILAHKSKINKQRKKENWQEGAPGKAENIITKHIKVTGRQ